MIKKLLLGLALAVTVQANAVIWHYDNISADKKTCRLSSWSGSQPSSGKLTIPSTYTHTDGKVYTVTTVAPHALDNLTTVTEITVPASIKKIGEAEAEVAPCYVDNFDNCPKLKKFNVDAANKVFSVYQDGILMLTESHEVLRVPQAYPVTGGKLTLDYNVWNVAREAFTGNSTITTLSLYRHMAINQNGGLNKTLNLATYEAQRHRRGYDAQLRCAHRQHSGCDFLPSGNDQDQHYTAFNRDKNLHPCFLQLQGSDQGQSRLCCEN